LLVLQRKEKDEKVKMGFKDLVKNFFSSRTQVKPDIPDDVTTDKVLRGLRRQRRLQKESVEKERLRHQIRTFEKARDRKEIYGIGKRPLLAEGKNYLKQGINKEKFMFQDRRPILKQKKGGFL